MAEIGIIPIADNNPERCQLVAHFLTLMAKATRHPDQLTRFPGTMPSTLSRRHLEMVSKHDYVCLEKSDGTRYMLLAVKTHVVLIDRRLKVYVIEPNPQILTQGYTDRQENTILDGELTYNQITACWEYLIYDAVVIDNDFDIAQLGFRQRMQAAEFYVAGPRLWAPFCAGLLRIRIKDFYERNEVRVLFDHICKDSSGKYVYVNNNRRDGVLCNENDGLIFAPVQMPYQLKNSDTLLKWKPPHLNSVDFQMQLTRIVDQRRKEPSVRVVVAYMGTGSRVHPLREVYVPFKIRSKWAANFEHFNNSIAEFGYNRSTGDWHYIRQREDKDIPNFQNTIISTIETIAESIEREELVLRMEKTANAPSDQLSFVDMNRQNKKQCTFINDYFDHRNHEYLLATPISITPPPALSPKEARRFSRNQHRRNDHHNANGDTAQEDPQDQSHQSHTSRLQSIYSANV